VRPGQQAETQDLGDKSRENEYGQGIAVQKF
jgi:hypothetical protein